MLRNSLPFFLLSCLCIETAAAKSLIDCRVVTEGSRECNPYGSRLHKAKEIVYDYDNKELIIEKSLPSPEEKDFVKVISVEDMLERYLEVQDPVRFQKSEKRIEEPTEVKEFSFLGKRDEKIEVSKLPHIIYGKYMVSKGDSLSKLAKKFGLRAQEIAKFNGFKKMRLLRIGETLKLPFEQKMVDAFVSATYKVEKGDTLIATSKKFKLDPKAVAEFNGFKKNAVLRTGKVIKLPLPYVLAEKKKEEARKKRLAAEKKSGKVNLVREFGQKKLRVTATAYTSHVAQTDNNPFLAAWGNRLKPGMKVIAVSRDLLTQYGMRNGTKVRIGGLPGYYKVRDKMNKRYKKRIDIYTGLDRRQALRWGRRSVVIYW